jgi:hypothetical protein
VAASWALANDRPGVGLAVCWEWPYPWPRHAIAYDDERVYSSGHITEESVEEYAERDGFAFTLRRPVRRDRGDAGGSDPDGSEGIGGTGGTGGTERTDDAADPAESRSP